MKNYVKIQEKNNWVASSKIKNKNYKWKLQ